MRKCLLIGPERNTTTCWSSASTVTAFAEILKSNGIAATPSYDLLPELDDLESNSEIAQKLATMKHDGVLVVATLDEG